MIQNTPEWLAWRKTKVTASDLPVILGLSKWCTPIQLWRRKLGFEMEAYSSPAMIRGLSLEPIVRDMVNDKLGSQFEPSVMVHESLEWAAASLDGWDPTSYTVLEIKCPNLNDHKCAELGEVPAHYIPQVQWQLFVTGAKEAIYASYHQDQLVLVVVQRDDEYIANELLPKAAEFYKHMIDMTEPARLIKDSVQIDDPDWAIYAKEYLAAKESRDFFDKRLEYFRSKLIAMTDDGDCHGAGVSLRRIEVKGRINWDTVWEQACEKHKDLLSLNLDSMRTKSQIQWRIAGDGASPFLGPQGGNGQES